MIIGYHLIWTVYGYWLPNDPRGSTSKTIASDVIAQLGSLHDGRKKIQPSNREIRQFQERSRGVLKFPLLLFAANEIFIIAEGIAEAIDRHNYTCYACAIMPDHVHMVIRRHRHQADEMLENLQESTRLRVRTAGVRTADHPVWGGPGWKVFLDAPDGMRRTIDYTNENPRQWRMPAQRWAFVTPYDGWPLPPGHSPSSPYLASTRNHQK
ncbi:MAG: hypothetical protein ABFC77_12970 [Thermoguttaceae bacterium]